MILIGVFILLLFLFGLVSRRVERTIVATVLLNVFAHGVSAVPASGCYARQTEQMDAGVPEFVMVGGKAT